MHRTGATSPAPFTEKFGDPRMMRLDANEKRMPVHESGVHQTVICDPAEHVSGFRAYSLPDLSLAPIRVHSRAG